MLSTMRQISKAIVVIPDVCVVTESAIYRILKRKRENCLIKQGKLDLIDKRDTSENVITTPHPPLLSKMAQRVEEVFESHVALHIMKYLPRRSGHWALQQRPWGPEGSSGITL